MPAEWSMTVPVISIVHIKEETAEALKSELDVMVVIFLDGLMVFCGEPVENASEYEDLNAVMDWARKNGSDSWGRLDPDANTVAELPIYEWS